MHKFISNAAIVLLAIKYHKIFAIELEHYLQILVNKRGKFVQGMLGVSDIITVITFPILLINKVIFLRSS